MDLAELAEVEFGGLIAGEFAVNRAPHEAIVGVDIVLTPSLRF